MNQPQIECFENPSPSRDYVIEHHAHEFTSVCPKTGQPDFATMQIKYVPGNQCIELKSLKLYLQGYRNKGIFYEAITNMIIGDLVAACSPKKMLIESCWGVRGGIHSVIQVEYVEPS